MFGTTLMEEFCTGIMKFRKGRVGQRNRKLYFDFGIFREKPGEDGC